MHRQRKKVQRLTIGDSFLMEIYSIFIFNILNLYKLLLTSYIQGTSILRQQLKDNTLQLILDNKYDNNIGNLACSFALI